MNLVADMRLALLEGLSPIVTRLPRFEKFFYFRVGGSWTSPG